MPSKLQSNFDYFLKNQDQLAKKYRGKVLVIYEQKVWKAYADHLTALEDAEAKLPPESFIIQKAEAGEDSVTETFYSRIIF